MRHINLAKIDICNSIVGLMYKGSRRYKSIFGGVLSLLLITAIASIIITFLNDFFGRDKAKMTFEQIKYHNPPSLNISNNFFFIVMTQFEGITLMRDDIIKIDAVLKTKKQNQWVSTPIDLIPCEENPNFPIDIFSPLESSKGVCFNTSGVSIEGSYVNEIYKYIQIRFTLCLNDNDNQSCYPQNKMEDFFHKTKPVAIIYFLDSAFQIYNRTDKVMQFYNYFDSNLTYQNNKETNLYYSSNELRVDESYFFPSNPKIYSGFMIESIRDKGAFRYAEDNTIMTFNFMSNNYKTVLHISYMQIVELLASICALINVLVILANLVGNYFNHYLFQSDLLNSFYESDIPDEKSFNKINIKLNSKFPLNNLSLSSHTNFVSTSILPNNNKIPFAETEKASHSITHIIHRKKCQSKHNFDHINIIKLSFGAFAPWMLNSHTKQQIDVFNKMNQSLFYYQELINVYKKLMEIDLLKYLILTDDQLSLYRIIPKPQYNDTNHSLKNVDREFGSLINDSEFHFLKSKEYIEKALNNNKEMKDLFISKDNKVDNKDGKLTEKLVELIERQIIVCTIKKDKQ